MTNLKHEVHSQVRDDRYAQVSGHQVRAQVWDQVCVNILNQVWAQVWDLRTAVLEQAYIQFQSQVQAQVWEVQDD